MVISPPPPFTPSFFSRTGTVLLKLYSSQQTFVFRRPAFFLRTRARSMLTVMLIPSFLDMSIKAGGGRGKIRKKKISFVFHFSNSSSSSSNNGRTENAAATMCYYLRTRRGLSFSPLSKIYQELKSTSLANL